MCVFKIVASLIKDVIHSYSNSYHPENHAEKQRSVAKCMEWKRKICGARHAAGRKLASASLTDLTVSLTNITGSSNISV